MGLFHVHWCKRLVIAYCLAPSLKVVRFQNEDTVAVFKLDVEKKFGQFNYRFYAQGSQAGAAVVSKDLKSLVENLRESIKPLNLSPEADQVIFRGIAYDSAVALTETVRLSRF